MVNSLPERPVLEMITEAPVTVYDTGPLWVIQRMCTTATGVLVYDVSVYLIFGTFTVVTVVVFTSYRTHARGDGVRVSLLLISMTMIGVRPAASPAIG